MNAVESLIQNVKTSCDNDSLMYCFKGDIIAQAYDRSLIYKLWTTPTGDKSYKWVENKDGNTIKEYVIDEDSGKLDDNQNYIHGKKDLCYYTAVIMPRLVDELCVNIYYKNTNGVWVDYRKCMNTFPSLSILVSSVKYEDRVKVDVNLLPKCTFMDKDTYIHYIDEHDGTDNDIALPNIEIDTNDFNKVSYRPFSVNSPTLPLTARHLMPDLKVTIPPEFDQQNFLVWLNGAFVPTTGDNTYRNVFYLKNAMSMIDSKVVNQILGAPKEYTGSGATVRLKGDYEQGEGESKRVYHTDEYRLDVRLRFFGWKDVNISPWYKPETTTTVPIVHNYKQVFIANSLRFTVPVNKDAHLIMLNGVVLDPSEYTIDPDDDRRVILKNAEKDAYNLLNSVLRDIAYDRSQGTTYYANVKPLDLIQDILIHKVYSLINFTSADPSKTLYMKRSTACSTNFPYFREITFSNVNSGDLVLVNGAYNRYEWIHKNTIAYPLLEYTYNAEEANLREEQIRRIYFINK